MIEVILYSYKNKNLRQVVDSILNNTIDNVLVHVYDQHPIDRSEKFKDVDYRHIFWDRISGPCELKGGLVYEATAPHILIISDDVILSNAWDVSVKEFIKDRDILVSGAGVTGVNRVDSFSIMPLISETSTFSLSQYAVREFVFGSKDVWNKFEYPYKLKYNGEQEMLSLNAFMAGIKIYSGPSSLYTDLGARTLENLYVPFSRDHGYGDVIDTLLTNKEFLKLHNIDNEGIKRLPYKNDDVAYNPEQMEFQSIDARKFISNTKAIY